MKGEKNAMDERIPKVSIGLAVYNGEEYLAEAIEAILTQTFTDFELIISDNASTDRTAEICQRYAKQDSRIRYYRNATNIGGANNENQTVRLARGCYFRWAAHDDVCAPSLLARCVAVLDDNPSIVLCSTAIIKIDGTGQEIEIINRHKATVAEPHIRLREMAHMGHWCEESYGLIRMAVLAKTNLQRNYTDSDRTLLSELSLYGPFHQIPEPLFYKRVHASMSTEIFPKWRARMAWFQPGFDLSASIVCPHWLQFFHYLEAISHAPLTSTERLRCYRYILGRWLWLEGHGRSMCSDLVLAALRMPRFLIKKLRNPVRLLPSKIETSTR